MSERTVPTAKPPSPSILPRSLLGRTGLNVPRIVFGSSALGNLYEAPTEATKQAIVRGWLDATPGGTVIDSAGKYGAGLALEKIGEKLRQLGATPSDVILSNKLGWLRTPLFGAEPTFEPGAWVGLQHDARQQIGYRGILQCWEQGCELLGEPYRPQLASVHDPDEYLAAASTEDEWLRRRNDVLEAYRALGELKSRGEVRAIGVGSKDWRVIADIAAATPLDWIMLANSLTIYRHPPDLIDWLRGQVARGVGVVNSAVFHAGFLVGGRFFDYREVSPQDESQRALFVWREKFLSLCRDHRVDPATACVQFALSPPGVAAVAMNTSDPRRIGANVAATTTTIPAEFWNAAKAAGIVDPKYPHVGDAERFVAP